MEDAVEALKMAFGAFVFMIAISIFFIVITQAKATAEEVFYFNDKTNFYDNVKNVSGQTATRRRIVGLETVIPTLYRYYRENFIVQIMDENGNILQLFDTTTEAEVSVAAKTIEKSRTDRQKKLLELYNNTDDKKNMYGAPWVGTTDQDAKSRIDFYVKGEAGYINNAYVDYTNTGLYKCGKIDNTTKFEEIFTEYQFAGDTITDEEDDSIELVGDLKAETKIIITYKIWKE